MKKSNVEEYKKSKELEGKEFENNIKEIIESNVNSMKNEIINSIVLEVSKKSKLNAKKSKKKIIHNGIKCDNCGIFPITGIRYKCMECENFNFCENCEKNNTHPHLFYKIKKNILS